ncbi:hypothetical protein [Microbulbifer celer]|uniref:Uncharacterized protein n=1 Tax=Microbulbifer celer TaxID=435905 RepID=A0ABW3U7K6_9GAMM|nr:hypothetical protein [Microbulbifer celer]UFN57114.1 hypothetical protein LPW13_16335 [Microbulbifer celer]
MKRVNLLSLKPVSETCSRLCLSHHERKWQIPGVVLEDQYQLSDGRMLAFTSDNCPYEEGLHILLLKTGHDEFEQVDLGLENTPGIYTNGKVVSESVMEFQFFNNENYRVEVVEKPRLQLTQFLSGSEIKYKSPLRRKSLSVTRLVNTKNTQV